MWSSGSKSSIWAATWDRNGDGSKEWKSWESVRRRIYQTVVAAGYADLTGAHVGLFRFESLEGSRPSRLAEQMSITKQSVNDLLRDLERRRYLVLRPDPSDRRARLVRLTARGRRLDAVVRAAAREAEREIQERLGAARFSALRQALLDLRGAPGASARPRRRARVRGPGGA